MSQIVVHKTSLAAWHSLVGDAERNTTAVLDEELQSYLVFLLMRFIDKPEYLSRALAIDFLEGVQQSGSPKRSLLRDVGDKCLLFAGLFPERVTRKQVSVNYCIDLGRTSYDLLSTLEKAQLAKLYASLCERFTHLLDVLCAMRQLSADKAYL